MTTTPTRQGDPDVTDRLYSILTSLPDELRSAYSVAASLANVKRQAEAMLEAVELTVLLAAPNDGKNEATRELQRRAALRESQEYQAARQAVLTATADVESHDAEIKSLQKSLLAALALSELHAARMNAYSIKAQLHTKDGKTNES